MIFGAVIAPWLCGIISAFYLTQSQFKEFIWFLMIAKTALLIISLNIIRQSDSFVMRSHSFKYVVLVYIAYLYVIWRAVTMAFKWTADHLISHGVPGLLSAIEEFAYVEVFINIFVVGLATWLLTSHFLDPKLIRQQSEYFE
jgi:hypothetical protein